MSQENASEGELQTSGEVTPARVTARDRQVANGLAESLLGSVDPLLVVRYDQKGFTVRLSGSVRYGEDRRATSSVEVSDEDKASLQPLLDALIEQYSDRLRQAALTGAAEAILAAVRKQEAL